MVMVKDYIGKLFSSKGIRLTEDETILYESYLLDPDVADMVHQISNHQKLLMEKWELLIRISDITKQVVRIANGTVDRPYIAQLDVQELGWSDLIILDFNIQEDIGLLYDPANLTLKGVPSLSGDFMLTLNYQLALDDSGKVYQKKVPIIINPDPKSLWKDLPSNADDIYYKPDLKQFSGKLGDKNLVALSKRGRSHANSGGFREDDFSYSHSEDTGWSLIVLADGAGSAKYSRKGSELACETTVDYFNTMFGPEEAIEIERAALAYSANSDTDLKGILSNLTFDSLQKAVHCAHDKLSQFASDNLKDLNDFHTTLVFVLFKKLEIGYLTLSFGVGDCPMALINRDMTSVELLNGLDVGSYGGGTRFITMPEIFSSDTFYSRFRFHLIDDFSYLFLMTDGIYDPKFAVESNLEKIDKWIAFIEDLNGANDSESAVVFSSENQDIETQLGHWMNFWSQGNHDDRTLAVLF